MKHEEKPFKRDRRISQRACRESKTKFITLLLMLCKGTHFFATLFFLSTKSFDGASHWHSATTQFPSISFRYASYLLRVGSVVSVCQFLFKDARQRVHSIVVLICIKVAQKRRYMLIETLVTLFPPERHYN